MATVLPAVLLVIYQAQASRMAALDATRERATLALLSVTTSQQKLLDDTRHFLQKLATIPLAQQLETPECARYLAELLALTNNYVNLGLPRADGALLCNAKPLQSPVNVADRPYFQRAIQQREFSISAFQVDRAAQVASVNFAFPVVEADGQNVLGAAVAVVSLDWWSHRLADLGLPSGAVARVTDPRGIVIARYPPAPEQLGRLWSDVDLQTPDRFPTPGALQRRNDQGERELVVFRPLLENRGEVVATMSLSMPLEAIYGAANSRLWTDILVLLGGLLLSFLLAHEGIRRAVSRPLNRLMTATDQLAHGQYTATMPTTGIPELAELAQRFNTMALRRQSVEVQLRQSEENLAITLHSIGDAVISTDTEGRISRMNEVAERLTGWPLAEARGLPLAVVLKLVNTDTREPLPDPVQNAIARDSSANAQPPTTLVARDAREYQIAHSAAPIRNISQTVVGVVLVFSDASEGYRIKQLLQESEARFRTLVALSSDWFWEQDTEFRFIGVDDRWLVNGRLSSTTLTGTRRWDQPALNLSDAQWEQHRALLQQHQEFRDFEIQRGNPDGSTYWISVSGTPIFDSLGQFIGYRGVGKDISKRKQAQEELRIAAIAFESQEGVLVSNEQFEILRSNRAFSRMTG
jgi:PAS domain S-box-containing protein